MPGYPIARTEKWTRFNSPYGSPYTAAEIRDYLVECRAMYSPQEPPFAIQAIDFQLSKSLTVQRFWLWRVVCEGEPEWFAVVGSGKSPFFGQSGSVDRWIYAETNDEGLAPEDFLSREIAKHP
jgi:hypothetical protein